MNSTECLVKIAPFLERLIEPRYDKYETNDYINNSSDCKNALKAFQEWVASQSASAGDALTESHFSDMPEFPNLT